MKKNTKKYTLFLILAVFDVYLSVHAYTVTITNETHYPAHITTTSASCMPVESTIEAQKNSSFVSPCKNNKITITATTQDPLDSTKTVQATITIILKKNMRNKAVPLALQQEAPNSIKIVQL